MDDKTVVDDASGDNVVVWNVATSEVKVFGGHNSSFGRCFSNDGAAVLSSGAGG